MLDLQDLLDLLDLELFNNLDLTSQEELPEDPLAQDLLVDLVALEESDVHLLAQVLDKPQPAQDLLVDLVVAAQEELDVHLLAQVLDKPQPAQDLVDSVVELEELDKPHLAHRAQDSVDSVEEAQPLLKAQDLVISTVEHLPDLLVLASHSAHLVALKAHASVDLEDVALASVDSADTVLAEESAVPPVVTEDLTVNNNNPASVREGPEDMEAEALEDLLTIEEIDFLTVYICAIREIVSANFVATISLSFNNYIIILLTGFRLFELIITAFNLLIEISSIKYFI